VPGERKHNEASSRPRGRRRESQGRPTAIPTYPVTHTSPEPNTSWRLLRIDWLGDQYPWETRVEERRVARHRLTRALTHLSEMQIAKLLLKDREMSLIATHFGRPFVVPGALESFLHGVHRTRQQQAANVARLDAYDAALVADGPDAHPTKPTNVSHAAGRPSETSTPARVKP